MLRLLGVVGLAVALGCGSRSGGEAGAESAAPLPWDGVPPPGSPCAGAPNHPEPICSPEGTIAGYTDVQVTAPSGDHGWTELLLEERPQECRYPLRLAYSRGELLWLAGSSCHRMERPIGWTFVGDPGAVPERELADLQARARLPREPLLRTVPAWREALRE